MTAHMLEELKADNANLRRIMRQSREYIDLLVMLAKQEYSLNRSNAFQRIVDEMDKVLDSEVIWGKRDE